MTQISLLASQRGAHVVRDPQERHYTPLQLANNCAQLLVQLWGTPARVVEPSVGGGGFVRAFQAQVASVELYGCDIDTGAEGLELLDHPHSGRGLGTLEYLDRYGELLADAWFAGNPPFSLATEHIRAILHHARRLAFVLPADVSTRATGTGWPDLFRDHPARAFPIDGRPWPQNCREVALHVWDDDAPAAGCLILPHQRIPLNGPLELVA